jgi:pimeloyl-ACP methyl ester carboxylesterase
MLARRAPGLSEVCPLKELPQVEYVYICGEKDDAIRPEGDRYVAREFLHVEPVVIEGAGHANIVLKYAGEVADAATKGL